MSIPLDSAINNTIGLNNSYQEILKNYGFSMPTTDLRAWLELLTATRNRSVKYAKPSASFMHFENEAIIDPNELAAMWPLALCDAYKGLYMDNDMKFRLGEVKGVNASHREIEGYTDEFGNLSTAANLDVAFRSYYIYDGAINEGRTRYINMLFGPYKNDNDDIATDLQWWNDYKSYVRKSIYAESAFSPENLLRTSAGATWRGGSFKQVNDNIMLMQKLYEDTTGIVSTYMTEYDLSIFMQEGYDGFEDNSGTTYERQFYCPLLFNVDKTLSDVTDTSFTYTHAVVNAALSVYNEQQKEFFEPYKYPLSSYWRPYYNFDYQVADSYYPYYHMLEQQHCSPVFTNFKWKYKDKEYDAHTVKNIIRFDDYAGAGLSKWKRIEAFRYFQVFYIEPGFGYDMLDVNTDWSLWDAILRALKRLRDLMGGASANRGLTDYTGENIPDINDKGFGGGTGQQHYCDEYKLCFWHTSFPLIGGIHLMKIGGNAFSQAFIDICHGMYKPQQMGQQASATVEQYNYSGNSVTIPEDQSHKEEFDSSFNGNVQGFQANSGAVGLKPTPVAYTSDGVYSSGDSYWPLEDPRIDSTKYPVTGDALAYDLATAGVISSKKSGKFSNGETYSDLPLIQGRALKVICKTSTLGNPRPLSQITSWIKKDGNGMGTKMDPHVFILDADCIIPLAYAMLGGGNLGSTSGQLVHINKDEWERPLLESIGYIGYCQALDSGEIASVEEGQESMKRRHLNAANDYIPDETNSKHNGSSSKPYEPQYTIPGTPQNPGCLYFYVSNTYDFLYADKAIRGWNTYEEARWGDYDIDHPSPSVGYNNSGNLSAQSMYDSGLSAQDGKSASSYLLDSNGRIPTATNPIKKDESRSDSWNADLPMYDEEGNVIQYPENTAKVSYKYSVSSGVATWSPCLYGGPHGEFYNPNTPQGYFEARNAFWKNAPRFGLTDDKDNNIFSVDTAIGQIKNGIVFSYKDAYYENNVKRDFTRLDYKSYLKNANWKIYRLNIGGTEQLTQWWKAVTTTSNGLTVYDYSAPHATGAYETYVLEFDNQFVQNSFIENLIKRSKNPYSTDASKDSKLNFTFIQGKSGNFIQLFRTNVSLATYQVYDANQQVTVDKTFIRVNMADNPIYQLDIRNNSIFDSDSFNNYLKSFIENTYESFAALAHPMYYSKNNLHKTIQISETESITSDFYIEGAGILGCVKGIDSNVENDIFYDNKEIMSSHAQYDDVLYKQLICFDEDYGISEYIAKDGKTYYYPNRTRVIEEQVPFELNLALNNALNGLKVMLDFEVDNIYHSNSHFEQYEVTEFGPLELDVEEVESYKPPAPTGVYKAYSVNYAVRLLLANMLKYKAGLENTAEVFKLINFDAIRLVLRQCVDPEVIDASKTLPQNVNPTNPKVDKRFNYWIYKAIQIFGDIYVDTDTGSKKAEFMNKLYARRTLVDSSINLIRHFVSSQNTTSYNDFTKVRSAVEMYHSVIEDESFDEWFTVYLHVLYQYRRYFINNRFNKAEGTMLKCAALERILPIVIEYTKMQPGFSKDILVDNIQEDMRVYYKQVQNTLYMKSMALINGEELEPDKVKYIFVKVDYVPNIGNNIGKDDYVLAKDYYGGEGTIIKVTPDYNNNSTMKEGFYTEHSGLLREVVWVPYRGRWAFKPIDGKYELISAEVQKNKEDRAYNDEWLNIAGVTEEVELQDNGYKNLRKTFQHDDCIFHIKFDIEKTTTDYDTEWSASRKESLGTETDCAIYFNYLVGIDPDILKATLQDQTLTDLICENRKCIDLWGIKIPEIKMPLNEHYKSNVQLVPVFDVTSDVQTVVGGVTTNTLYPIEEREYGIQNGIHLADDLIAAYNKETRGL